MHESQTPRPDPNADRISCDDKSRKIGDDKIGPAVAMEDLIKSGDARNVSPFAHPFSRSRSLDHVAHRSPVGCLQAFASHPQYKIANSEKSLQTQGNRPPRSTAQSRLSAA
ncbi:hypothetical protein G7K_5091-t1 [Saitoella complicata NRRL Y-17804]|uniref:Uncharacterized protein n=1 Tax=Saitoella complicata (strain BCRC 22490 / CBS 7301 / JCM 7358 / NBRC 10748 / NRRL Y-17804) TaxID=698492 RepID=A0A0E9NNH8_SAICN|nr:hypothetical protein G7K_5091-t1 [Saitoella complicata NRRL Y-17804]